MAAEIIHDDDVAGFEEWNELLFDIGAEAFAVDWAVEDARRRELVAAQGAEESQRPPVATRHQAPHPITLGPPSFLCRQNSDFALDQALKCRSRRRPLAKEKAPPCGGLSLQVATESASRGTRPRARFIPKSSRNGGRHHPGIWAASLRNLRTKFRE